VPFCDVAASVAAHESGNNGENTKFLYLALLTFVPITAYEHKLDQSSRTNAFALKDIRLLVGASGAGVGFTMNFEGEF
jgi:hypothetical protein